MGRSHPRQWGDKTVIAGDPEHPLVVNTVQLDQLSDVELAALERFADARLAATDVDQEGPDVHDKSP